jgi:hypothetical protein
MALYRGLATPSAQMWQRLAEDLVASQVTVLIKLALSRVRAMMTFSILGAMTLVCVGVSYPFQPPQFMTVFVWLVALAVVVTLVFTVIGIERDEILSRLSQTRPGRVDLNAAFIGRMIAYVGLPLLALAATNFPRTGAVVLSWLEPLVRALH